MDLFLVGQHSTLQSYQKILARWWAYSWVILFSFLTMWSIIIIMNSYTIFMNISIWLSSPNTFHPLKLSRMVSMCINLMEYRFGGVKSTTFFSKLSTLLFIPLRIELILISSIKFSNMSYTSLLYCINLGCMGCLVWHFHFTCFITGFES